MSKTLNNLISDPNIISFFVGKNKSLEKVLKLKELEKFSIVKMEQVHGNNFAEITEAENQIIPKVDAIITTKKNVLLSVKSADCLPILIHWKKDNSPDENQKNNQPTNIIAAIHSGRAGTEKKILTKVLLYLKKKYKVGESENLTIWLGPAICKKCYQVDKKTDLHYDLYQKNLDQIEKVFPKDKFEGKIKIIRNKYCTFHNNDLFYSYRKTGKGVKMNYSLIMSR